MKQYLQFNQTKRTYSIQHSFGIVFKKIETVLFSFLCVIFLITSKVNSNFTKDVSFSFVSVSLPIVKIISFPFNLVINLTTNLHELIDAKNENKILKEDLEELRDFYIKGLNVYQENKELRNILNFVTSKTSKFKVAKIIGRSHQIFNQKIFIDAGKNRGIKEGSIVTGTRGIIGRIIEVGEDKSRILLVTDANSRIPVITSQARARGILAGLNNDSMEILYVSKSHSIEVGDRVFTSGDGDTLPSGLLIGVVTKVDKSYVAVSMVEDVNNADIVTIIDY